MSVSFSDRVRRSLLAKTHERSGATLRVWHDQIVVAHYGAPRDERDAAAHLALCDLSTLDRTGFKGPDTPAWLADQSVSIPSTPNAVVAQSGLITARLSWEEHLFLRAPFKAPSAHPIWQVEPPTHRVYPLPRQDSHAWLYVCGDHAPLMLSYLCAVDFSDPAFTGVAQTSVAKLNAIVIQDPTSARPGFHLLCDQPSVDYWWQAVMDAAAPLNGQVVGVDALLGSTQEQFVTD
ncbi:MAG: sarcosine oxidase [Pseudomonadota bacterium]